MKTIIGSTGFVGKSLINQTYFNYKYNSKNINEISKIKHDLVVCAAAPGVKWYANKNPIEDKKKINLLIKNLKKITCNKFILISTVDVFHNPILVNEKSLISTDNLETYGYNRYKLEQFIKKFFKNFLIIRLPGLVGKKLKKNLIYDLKYKKNFSKIDSRNMYQFYSIRFLWKDITLCLHKKIKLIHFTSPPLKVSTIYKKIFKKNFLNHTKNKIVKYNMISNFSYLISKSNKKYQYGRNKIIKEIKLYIKGK
jgi:nucleoside-diphosphate-sugar epimerase|tara:strand:- start:2762 stop:3520 length:759 start_codon:yes stop_codon:yes gene_type:complete